MILYRPVGLHELRLIAQTDYRVFPPRLPEQPIFYPVLNFGYAEQIARDWNTKSNSFAGFVTRFEIEDEYVSRFPVQVVAGVSMRSCGFPPTSWRSSMAIYEAGYKSWRLTTVSSSRAR